jgi:hypothetical protein
MYVNDQSLAVIEVLFLKGRCCGRLTIDSISQDARGAIVTFAEYVADHIPLDGSVPRTDKQLQGLVPASGELSDWVEDTSVDPNVGPRLITTSAFDWANGGAGPFADHGFEAVAIENYKHQTEGWDLTLELVYQTTSEGANAAFHHRNPEYPDDPYWDVGTRIH